MTRLDGALGPRLLGRRAHPVGTQVLVVVDPDQPGAAGLRLPDGEVLASHVAALAVREAGELVGDVVREPSATATVDQVASALRLGADVPLAVVDAATLATGTSLGDVVADPRADCALLRSAGGAVVAVRVPSADRDAVADMLLVLLGRRPGVRVVELVADACAEAGLAVVDRSDPVLPVALAGDAVELATAAASVDLLDEVSVRLRRAQRSDDGFLSTFLVRPLSRRVTPSAVRRGIAPARVTAVALLLGLLAAAAYALAATGHPAAGQATSWRVVGSLLLLASLVVDCVDGEVARSTRTFSARGGWLDVGADRVKEYAVYAGLAVGAGGGRSVWWLAFAAMALLVTRHFVDFGFAASRSVMQAKQTRAHVPAGRSTEREGGVAAWSERTSARPALKWAKRAVIMPVGERTLLLIVLAPVAGVRATLAVLLALGVVAAAWTTAGRVGRTWRGAGAGTLPERLVWLRPALERVAEQGLVALLVVWLEPSALPGAFAWLAVVAFGLYDVVYRQRLAGATVRGLLGPVPFGWPLRVLVVLVVLLAAGAHAGQVLVVAAGLLLVAVVTSSAAFWSAPVASTP